jgi:catechol 2,3-dioxygenase-like lactoylglutathione lyase family enzyme
MPAGATLYYLNGMYETFFYLVVLLFARKGFSQAAPPAPKTNTMKMNPGIVTAKLAETKVFYTTHLGFGISFENEFYLLLHIPGKQAEISFLLPNHPSQQPLFQAAFTGKGMYLTIEVSDVDSMYQQVKKKGLPVKIEMRQEPWGDKHFAIEDPNGIGIDIVQYTPPNQQ